MSHVLEINYLMLSYLILYIKKRIRACLFVYRALDKFCLNKCINELLKHPNVQLYNKDMSDNQHQNNDHHSY